VIEFQQVHKTYRVAGREIPALNPTSLTIEDGQVFGLIGHSGAGKSTMLRLINRLEEPSGGKIIVDGEDVTAFNASQLRGFRQQVGMIFQHFNLLASKTVADNVALPLTLAGELSRSEIDKRVTELLARVGLQDHAKKYPAQLSGGQKQRVGIARALSTNPKILLCDEATSALDPQTTASVLQLLAEINRELKLTIVLITHEMDVIRRVCDCVAVMDAGQIVEQGSVADVFLHPQHPTTKRFVQEDEQVDEGIVDRPVAGETDDGTRGARIHADADRAHRGAVAQVRTPERVCRGDAGAQRLQFLRAGGDLDLGAQRLTQSAEDVDLTEPGRLHGQRKRGDGEGEQGSPDRFCHFGSQNSFPRNGASRPISPRLA